MDYIDVYYRLFLCLQCVSYIDVPTLGFHTDFLALGFHVTSLDMDASSFDIFYDFCTGEVGGIDEISRSGQGTNCSQIASRVDKRWLLRYRRQDYVVSNRMVLFLGESEADHSPGPSATDGEAAQPGPGMRRRGPRSADSRGRRLNRNIQHSTPTDAR